MRIEMPTAVMRDITNLLPVEYNPRYMSDEEAEDLQEGLQEFGLVQPLVVNMWPGREHRIIGGEQRWRRLRENNVTEALCVELQVPLDKEKELNVRLNRNHGQWDWEKLGKHFVADDLVLWGFEPEEMEEIPFDGVLPDDLEGGFASFGGNGDEGQRRGKVIDPEFVLFAFGDVRGRVARRVYDSFSAALKQQKAESGKVLLADVIEAWLGISTLERESSAVGHADPAQSAEGLALNG